MRKSIICIYLVTLLFFSCEKKEETQISPLTSDLVMATSPDNVPITLGDIRSNMKNFQPTKEDQKEVITVKKEDYDGNPLQIEEMSYEEKHKYLVGEWMRYFPTPAGNWGYIFYDDGTFKYYERSKAAVEKLFLRTYGEWHIEENDIEVRLVKYETSDRAADADTPSFLSYPSDAKAITTVLDDQNWSKIGSLESVVTDMVIEQWNFPPQITLTPILLDTILIDKPLQYYKFK